MELRSDDDIKKNVLQEIIQFLDGKLGDGLKAEGPKMLDLKVDAGPTDGGGLPPGDSQDGEPDEDDDEAKLLALARASRG